MNHGKLNAAPWSIDVPLKAGMVVTFQNGFYQSLKGRNVAEPFENPDFVYLGEVDRFGTLARRNAANLSSQDVSDWITKLNIYTIPEVDELLTKKADLVDGVVPAYQLPSYVDDVIEGYRKDADGLFYKNANFTGPITGESGKLYLDLINSETYRWTGTIFAFVGAKTFKLAISNQDDGTNGYEIVNEAVSILGFSDEHFIYSYLPDPSNPTLNIPTLALKKIPFSQPNLTDKYLPVWNETTKTFDNSQIYQAADGRVGIGKTNPSHKLDVNGEIKGDALISKTYTTAERNAITSPVEGMLIYQSESPKGFYKYESGLWTQIGANIGNSDLTILSNRLLSQAANYTHDTAGFKYYLKGLIDKTGNTTYAKVLVVHPTTGETVTRDFADPAATTLAVQNANIGQKTAIRTALLGSATPASPVINFAFPLFLIRGENQYIYIAGINLTLLDPTNIYFIDSSSVRRDAFAYYNITGSEVQTLWDIPSVTPKGIYDLKILNGSVTQGLSNGVIQIVDSFELINKDVLVSESVVRMYGGLTPNRVYNFAKNLITIAKNNNSSLPTTPLDPSGRVLDVIGAITVKTDNFLSGALSSSWDITFTIRAVTSNTVYSSASPLFGISETTNAEFTTIESLIKSVSINQGSSDSISIGGTNVNLHNGGFIKIVIRKTGDKVIFIAFSNANSNTPNAFQINTIDTTKNYALFFSEYNNSTPNASQNHTYEILQIKYKN